MDAISWTSHLPWTTTRRSFAQGGTERTTIEAHDLEVREIATKVRSFYDVKQPFRLYHGSTNSTRQSASGRDPKKVIDTSRLNHVVRVDTATRTALVEPNVPMDRLVEETLKYGLIPPVVMEFPGITAGGGYSGTSGESSSFKHGFFDRTLNSVEMVLADGEIVIASESQHSDLFRGAAGAVGTLGVVTMIEIQLREATKFVETTYHPVSGGIDEAIKMFQDFTARPVDIDYVDGIMYSSTTGAIITGRMTDDRKEGLPIHRFSDARDPWFYLHVQECITKSAQPTQDLIPLPDYLFRYDRGGFWVGEEAFNYFSAVPFNSFTRWFLDDFLSTRMLYNALHASGQFERMIVQDLALPFDTAAEFVARMNGLLDIGPLWLCPLKQSPRPTMHPHLDEYEDDEITLKPMLNIGLWVKAPPTHDKFVEVNKEIEHILHELRGMKWLYAQTWSTESDFWSDFDRSWYDRLRSKYHAETLPTVHEKVAVNTTANTHRSWQEMVLAVWPMSGLYGIKRAIDSGDYLPARTATWKEWIPRS